MIQHEFEELLEDTFALIVEIPRNLAVKNYRAEFEHMIAEQQVYDELPGTEFGYKKRMEKPVG